MSDEPPSPLVATVDVRERAPMNLYRFYDKNNALLYVGISLHAAIRASQHKLDKPWWGDVSRMEVEHLDGMSRKDVERYERSVIEDERPIYNKVWNRLPEPEPIAARPAWAEGRLALSVAEFAAATGCTEAHVHALIRRGEIRSLKLGRRRLILADELERLAAAQAAADDLRGETDE